MALTKATLIDLNANELILDLDADTSITADTDDTIHFKIAGSDEITMTAAGLSPAASDGNALGTAALEWSDLFLADGAVINFGDDQDVSLTHVADTGLLLSSTDKLQFNDASQFIHGSSATVLSLGATDEIDLTATAIDINGTCDVSGAFTAGSTIVATGTIQGTTITATTAFVPDASDGAALGTTALEFSDLFLADGAVIQFGDDQDVSLTHVADTGLLLSSTDRLQFGDSGTYIFQSADGVLDLVSDTEIELNATTLDINANVEISGTTAQVGVATFTAVPVFPNDTIETADIQDNAVSLAKMAGLARGKIIYGDSSGDPAALTVGSSGQALVSDGTDISWGSGGAISTYSNSTNNRVLTSVDSSSVNSEANLTFDGSTLAVTGDATVSDDLSLVSDSAVLNFGADSDTSLTHTDGTGLTLNSTNKLCFNDASQFIQGASATVLDIAATDEIELTATLIDVVGNFTNSGTIVSAGVITAPSLVLGSTAVTTTPAELNLIDGGTARGTDALASGDGILINDAGTMKMTNVDNVRTYMEASLLADDKTVAGSLTLTDAVPLKLLRADDESSTIWFGDASDADVGQIRYDHDNNQMMFKVATYEPLAILADQTVCMGSNGSNSFGDGSVPTNLFVKNNGDDGYAVTMYNEGNRDTRHGLAIASGYNNASGTNRSIDFYDGDFTLQGSIGFQQGTVQYGAFTANHDVQLPDADNDAGYDYGTLLEITELFYKTQKDGTPFVKGIRYKVRKSSSAYSKSVLGAYSGKYALTARDPGTSNLHTCYVLGDGHILCNREKGNIAVGDGICASATDGIGMKADKTAMIIGFAQEAVSFSDDDAKLVAVQYGLQQFTPWE